MYQERLIVAQVNLQAAWGSGVSPFRLGKVAPELLGVLTVRTLYL
jgi:hypothetical protein